MKDIARRLEKETANESSAPIRIRKPPAKYSTLTHWKQLEDRGRKDGRVRRQALEWLRLEALRLIWPNLTEQEHDEAKSDYDRIHDGRYHCLLELPSDVSIDPVKRPDKLRTWAYPEVVPPTKRGPAVRVWRPVLKYLRLQKSAIKWPVFMIYPEGRDLTQHRLHDPNQLVLCIQADRDEEEIWCVIQSELKRIKAAQGRQRAKGGGNHTSLDHLWETITQYAKWQRQRGKKQAIGADLQTFGRHRNYSAKATQLFHLATEMLDATRRGPAAWGSSFR